MRAEAETGQLGLQTAPAGQGYGGMQVPGQAVAGRRVLRVLQRRLGAGEHSVILQGRDGRGGELSSGVYLLRLQAGGVVEVRRVVYWP